MTRDALHDRVQEPKQWARGEREQAAIRAAAHGERTTEGLVEAAERGHHEAKQHQAGTARYVTDRGGTWSPTTRGDGFRSEPVA